ncbi:DUF2971 domain-containing protein [Marinomonas sp.]|nr:DUF2971 domain-containing protein [Marinomonas sp.]MDB4837640.1 DUF2971 domain-containing protein [Marinomonas sp.]
MEPLYHYTDLTAFLSIIQSKKLWLTGAYNLNDHQEITWALGKIGRRLEELSKEYSPECSDIIWPLLQASSGVPHICSLSSEYDLLSQWRAYGQNGAGIAIGFKRSTLPDSSRLPIMTTARQNSLSLNQVIYSQKNQDEIINQILLPIFQNEKIDDSARMAMSTASSTLSGLLSIFKNEAFHEENEWRIIHRPIIMGPPNGNESKIYQSISPPKYRVSGGKIITYFEYDFSGAASVDIFEELVLGPKCEVSRYDLSILLTENGLGDLPIKRSKASYR